MGSPISPMPRMGGSPMGPPSAAPGPDTTLSSLTGPLPGSAGGSSALDQKAGILQQLRTIEGQLTEGKNSIQAIASQYPASSSDSRAAIEAIEAARSRLIGLLTTMLSQTTETGAVPPRVTG